MSDVDAKFSKSIGWMKGNERTGRYAMVIDHGKIVYAENEPGGDVTVGAVEALISRPSVTTFRCLGTKLLWLSYDGLGRSSENNLRVSGINSVLPF